MFIAKAAHRYASALFETAKEQNKISGILEDIKYIQQTLKGSKELVNFLKSPIIDLKDKSEVLDTLFFDDIQQASRQFIELLARKDRLDLLLQISEAFSEKYREHAGIITVDVSVAQELNDRQREKLRENLAEKMQKKIEMNITCDETLKGGMAIRIGDTVIDGTVKHKVNELEKLFLSAAV